MSWKSVEMQVAIPRTQEAGKQQDQLMRQSQHFQETLAQTHQKELQLKRKKVNEFDETRSLFVKEEKDEASKEKHKKHHTKQKKKMKKQQPFEHPYLGQSIDYSG